MWKAECCISMRPSQTVWNQSYLKFTFWDRKELFCLSVTKQFLRMWLNRCELVFGFFCYNINTSELNPQVPKNTSLLCLKYSPQWSGFIVRLMQILSGSEEYWYPAFYFIYFLITHVISRSDRKHTLTCLIMNREEKKTCVKAACPYPKIEELLLLQITCHPLKTALNFVSMVAPYLQNKTM